MIWNFSDMIVGHERNIKYLERVLKRGALASAYLFYGPEAVGKKTAAFKLAKSVLCREGSRRPLGGCGNCLDCREAGAASHPDLIFLSRERSLAAEDLKREIGIKNIHELRRILGMTPWRGGRRVIIIDQAEALSGEAQSALLKTLEEPPPGTVFVLVSVSAEAVYPTIRSRSVALSFSLVADENMRLLLEGLSAEEHLTLLGLAQGRPGFLSRLISDKNFFKEFQTEAGRFGKVLRSDIGAQFSFSDSDAREPGAMESFLNFAIRHFHYKLQAMLAIGEKSFESSGRSAILKLSDLLRILVGKLSVIETVAVNRRLLSDSVFLELQTSGSSQAGQYGG